MRLGLSPKRGYRGLDRTDVRASKRLPKDFPENFPLLVPQLQPILNDGHCSLSIIVSNARQARPKIRIMALTYLVDIHILLSLTKIVYKSDFLGGTSP
jgi:hypothetical protein